MTDLRSQELEVAFNRGLRQGISESDPVIKALHEALKDTLTICVSRGTKLGLDDGGPVLDKARAAVALAEGK